MSHQVKEEMNNNYSYEVKINNDWKEFILLDKEYAFKDGIEDIRINRRLSELDNDVYGKYFKGCIGYNTSGWWEYIKVNKNEIRCKNEH
tara:strand:+ start:2425 stop:2691 length:267 start_codon:yes stop_codon:yes gene_type:complete